MGNATFLALFNSYDTTDIDVVPTNPYGPSNMGTDIIFDYGTLPVNVAGRYTCQLPGVGLRCNRSQIIFDGDKIDGYSDEQLRSLSCHEIGHSLGLIHGRDADPPISDANDVLGCMQDPPDGLLGIHNVGHLDFHY